ncbi:MAG: sigma-70 family RNA polymerase sigma factor [Acidobacteria bacterium]|nr:sigma-70 family RNA polymerase sigma factor [Acidobacteriota bacterium]
MHVDSSKRDDNLESRSSGKAERPIDCNEALELVLQATQPISKMKVRGDLSLANGLEAPRHSIEPLFDIDDQYSRRHDVIRYLLGYGVDSAEAEDIVQDVFLKALRPSAGSARPGNPFAWLITCAKRLAIRRGQRRRREAQAPSSWWGAWEDQIADGAPNAEDRLDSKQIRLRVASALSRLSPRERQCLMLRSRGRTFREIGEELGIRLHQAAYITDVAIEKVQRSLGVTG